MTRFAYGLAAALLLLSLTVPAFGKNYQLHSPKLWSQQEKEQYDKENPPAVQEKEPSEQQVEQLKIERENSEKLKKQLKKDKEQAEKQKALLKIKREQLKKEKELVKKEKERIREVQVLVKDGVSYREVTVQKGDSVYGISRKYSKEGSSYSETLRFNDIKDPDKIIDGDVIKVPLFRGKKAKQSRPMKQMSPKSAMTAVPRPPVTAKAVPKIIPAKTGSTFSNNSTLRQKTNAPPDAIIIKTPADASPAPSKISIQQPQIFSNNSTSRQKLYEQAIKSYRNGDCQTAIQLFGRFLAEHTPSPLAADASLFIADCYIKLSGK